MDIRTITICILFSLTNGLAKFNNEYNRNLYDDDMEYSFIDPDTSQEHLGNGMEHFFRQVRSLEEDYKNVETIDTREYFREMPKPEFLKRLQQMNEAYGPEEIDEEIYRFEQNPDEERRRAKRSTDGETDENRSKEKQKLIDEQEEPLEIIVLDINNDTEASDKLNETNDQDNPLKINDFLRFKRDLENYTSSDDDKSRSKREKDEKDNKRDGLIKDQWVKQPYPVTRNIEPKPDDNLRAPRVHFVTQRRSESAPPPVYHNYDRNLYDRNYRFGDMDSDYDKGYYYRFPRHYDQYQGPYHRNYYRDEQHPPTTYDNEHDGYYNNERPVYKQRRIIYYTTLPEVVRSPSREDIGDRYNYRDSYESDSRYARIPLQNMGRPEPYGYRKPPYPVDKLNYDESGPVKGAYPLKVSTDVKEIKKIPERRVYTEGDRRYNYNPYQPADRYDPIS